MKKNEIIKSISELCLTDSIQLDTLLAKDYLYTPINRYIGLMSNRVKPETATTELTNQLMKDVFEGTVRPEVNIDGDFIDFIVEDKGSSNPVLIELKPLFKINNAKNELIQQDLKYSAHQKQIQKYLSKYRVEYVILTNINQVYIFNRTALIDFKPFKEITFPELLTDYLITENLWDVLRKHEESVTSSTLDTEFFIDLKKWFEEFKYVEFIENDNLSKEEIKVLFLNKFIFIKTLEDYGLIPYRFIQDQFEDYANRWVAKGNYQIFRHFFAEMEDFFEIHYDTELFSTNFWDFIEKDEKNLDNFRRVFELILGLDSWSNTFGKGLVHYNYRSIDEDIFGKAYETWIAENRKDEGIFYTPATITVYMADQIVDSLFKEPIENILTELKKPEINTKLLYKLSEDLNNIKIIDSTAGSGSFLIKVLKRIYYYYEKLNEATSWTSKIHAEDLWNMPANIQTVTEYRQFMNFNTGSELILISRMILNHIFAADKDERAIDTAKTNIWKEAVKLNPGIYNYRRLDSKKIHILPNLEMNFIKGDSLTDFDFSEQIDIIQNDFKDDIIKLYKIRENYIDNVYKPELLSEVKNIKKKIRTKLKEKHTFKDSLFYPLEFFFCFFDKDGNPKLKDEQGFDGIISNPPWEAIKPVKKEFAELGKAEMDILDFNNWFENKINIDEDFKNKWNKYTLFYTNYTEYLYKKYEKQSSGDPNYYKFFLERDFQLIKYSGSFCLLIPSGFQTDEGSDKLRKLLISQYN